MGLLESIKITNPLRYAVRSVRFNDGERVPVLICRNTGIPLWYPTLFVISQIRNNNKASATMASNLEAIKLFLLWADSRKIDIQERFSKADFLTNNEVESLKTFTQQRIESLSEANNTKTTTPYTKKR